MINQEQLSVLWPQIKFGLMSLWGQLDNDELEATKGDFSLISKLVQDKFGEDSESIKQRIDNLIESFDNDTDKGIDPDKSSYHRSPIHKEDLNVSH